MCSVSIVYKANYKFIIKYIYVNGCKKTYISISIVTKIEPPWKNFV